MSNNVSDINVHHRKATICLQLRQKKKTCTWSKDFVTTHTGLISQVTVNRHETFTFTNITCNSCFDPIKSTRELCCVQSYYSIRLPLLLLVKLISKYWARTKILFIYLIKKNPVKTDRRTNADLKTPELEREICWETPKK